jgi:tetratricopeptide (TPR) repeat protein
MPNTLRSLLGPLTGLRALALLLLGLSAPAVAVAQEDPRALFFDAFELLRAGKAQEAVGKFEQGLAQDPQNATARFYLGEAYRALGDDAKARTQYQASLEAEADSAVAGEAKARLAEAVQYALTVQTDPPAARVRILNIKPKYEPGMRLAPGAYHIEVSAPGHETRKEWIKIDREDRVMRVTLLAVPARGEAPGKVRPSNLSEDEAITLIDRLLKNRDSTWFAGRQLDGRVQLYTDRDYRVDFSLLDQSSIEVRRAHDGNFRMQCAQDGCINWCTTADCRFSIRAQEMHLIVNRDDIERLGKAILALINHKAGTRTATGGNPRAAVVAAPDVQYKPSGLISREPSSGEPHLDGPKVELAGDACREALDVRWHMVDLSEGYGTDGVIFLIEAKNPSSERVTLAARFWVKDRKGFAKHTYRTISLGIKENLHELTVWKERRKIGQLAASEALDWRYSRVEDYGMDRITCRIPQGLALTVNRAFRDSERIYGDHVAEVKQCKTACFRKAEQCIDSCTGWLAPTCTYACQQQQWNCESNC